MYCPKCGTKCAKSAGFCAECGASLNEEVVTTNNAPVQSSGSSFGWGVLGFFFPIVGLILFIVWNNDRKKDAKAAGIGAIIGTVMIILLYVLIFIIFFAVGISEGVSHPYYYY